MSAPAATLQTILHLNFIHTSFPEHPLLRIRSLSCVGARPIVLCGEEVPLNMFLGMGGMWVVWGFEPRRCSFLVLFVRTILHWLVGYGHVSKSCLGSQAAPEATPPGAAR